MIFSLILFLGLLLFCPELAIAGSKYGITLWLTQLIPTLLPFFILIKLLCLYLPDTSSRRPFLLLGLLCGYPSGAALVAEQYNRELLSKRAAYFFLGFVNNPSPMFVTVFCGQTILHLSTLQSFLLFGLLILSSLLGSLLFYAGYLLFVPDDEGQKQTTAPAPVPTTKTETGMQLIDSVISDSFAILIRIGGYVAIFSILGQCLYTILPAQSWYTAPLTGCLEITCGTSYLTLTHISLPIKKVLMMSILSFGGLSAAAQTGSILSSSELSLRCYMIAKLVNCLVATSLAFFFFT